MMELNVELFYKNTKPEEYISMVPTSAHTGDGMGDLLSCLCLRLQNKYSKRLAYTEELSASVMEVSFKIIALSSVIPYNFRAIVFDSGLLMIENRTTI